MALKHREKTDLSLTVGVGVFAHNEENNIESLLQSLLQQRLEFTKIETIYVISSGSSDNTNRIVKRYASEDSRILLVEDAQRSGKSVAMNQFIDMAQQEILVTLSADLRLHKDAVEQVVLPFSNLDVGMVGGHPKPINLKSSRIGREVGLLWELHHMVSLIEPKCGEIVAFRNVVRRIPEKSAVDDATLEVLLRLLGYQVVYAPLAIVYNKGPKNFREFIRQRRRVAAGHQWLQEKYHLKPSTTKLHTVMRVVLLRAMLHPDDIVPLTRLILMEAIAKFLAFIDYSVLKQNPYVWNMISR